MLWMAMKLNKKIIKFICSICFYCVLIFFFLRSCKNKKMEIDEENNFDCLSNFASVQEKKACASEEESLGDFEYLQQKLQEKACKAEEERIRYMCFSKQTEDVVEYMQYQAKIEEQTKRIDELWDQFKLLRHALSLLTLTTQEIFQLMLQLNKKKINSLKKNYLLNFAFINLSYVV